MQCYNEALHSLASHGTQPLASHGALYEQEADLQRQQFLTLPALGVFVVILEQAHIEALISRQKVQLGAIDHKLSG